MNLSLRPLEIRGDFGNEAGALVLLDGALLAVLGRLDNEFYGPHRGRWNLEAGFGECAVAGLDAFERLESALLWIAGRVHAPASSVAAMMDDFGPLDAVLPVLD